uniref:UDENN FNIP1/2-type domain-containing protein n=1 Tax=Stomoxys calcitrans TaxID=35570 RepID=A0A1I8NXL9_STOCA
MALLNKLFFPSSSSASSSTPTPATSCNTQSAASLSLGSATSAVVHNNNQQAKYCGSRKLQNPSTHSKNYLSQFPFDGSQVRILVYRECDTRGRRLLFDSNALEKVYLKERNGNNANTTKHNVVKSTLSSFGGQHHQHQNASNSSHNNNHKESLLTDRLENSSSSSATNSTNKGHSNGSFIEVCEEYGFKHNRPNTTDISSIGEMVFGALAMSFRGTSLKVHWLEPPSRLLCSQVFLTPLRQSSNGHSPYSTLSTNSLATPRTSICSEHGSIDGLSMSSSFSLPFSVGIGRRQSLTPSDLSTSVSSPLDVPSIDQQSILTSTDSAADSGHRFSSSHSTGNDSGYSAMSRGGGHSSSDQWSASYQYSTRSSLGSVISEQSERVRKCSIDSNFYPSSSSGSASGMRLSSDGSLQRRISRNMVTSFENENSMNDLIGFVTDNYTNVMMMNQSGTAGAGGSEGLNLGINYRRASYATSESRSNPEMGRKREVCNNMKSISRRAKLGLAVCITMSESFEEEMELFCSEHIALFESMLSRLRASTERAYIHHNHFLQIMFQIWQDTQQWFLDLFTAPRIKCPVWLSITTSGSKYSKNVAERFIKELCWLLSFADTKDTNFFISTMLTAILTHHLGWVPTVSPFSSSSSTAAIEQRAKLLQVSQKHPYNALWAQMGDLFGAIGIPPKLARTVIYGTEKLSVERLLNVLTYFIRCGEVRRSSKKEEFRKETINEIVGQSKNETFKKSTLFGKGARSDLKGMMAQSSGKTLSRSQTCKQNLSLHGSCQEGSDFGICEKDEEYAEEDETDHLTNEAIRTYKKNEIPTVLAFRDSRFVQQELRIGNYLMDTGIEKNSLPQYQQAKQANGGNKSEGRIRLTLTTPENVELNVEDATSANDEDGVMEAIEIEPQSTEMAKEKSISSNIYRKKKPFFWSSMTAGDVKEGLSLNEVNKIHQSVSAADHQATTSEDRLSEGRKKPKQHLSLSDLITQNSMGKSDCPMTWGIEPVKENVSLEEQIHFDYCHKLIERDRGICRNRDDGKGVVFVLGDNEPLVNIKKSTEDLSTDASDSKSTTPTEAPSQSNEQFLCPLHQRLHTHSASDTSSGGGVGGVTTLNSQQQLKKHSGVKFNFEQYPQIVTNYMKSKNLLMTNYDLLMDKCSKLEISQCSPQATDCNSNATNANTDTPQQIITNTTFPQTAQTTSSSSSSQCLVCKGLLNAYQTPSNATELEFETDEVHGFANKTGSSPTLVGKASATTTTLTSVSSQASVQTLISAADQQQLEMMAEISKGDDSSNPLTRIEGPKKTTFSANQKKCSSQRGSVSSVAAKCAAVNEAMHLLQLPIPLIKELPQDDELSGDMKLPVGFIPSLFLNVSDHYIPDMVLQGTYASPSKWEINLREDLALAAHSASLISLPAENIAIIADMEKWDVKLISSQSQHFPYAGGQSAPVGMSQLVSSMLETVQIMNSAGISAYECLSFMESKLQEIYLHSETLAAFLLETDFCSLSAVTTALNLSENDVPLLLSIASIHTPQISKKCGISFR